MTDLKCFYCNSTSLSIRAKQTHNNIIDADGNLIMPKPVEWKAFECVDCNEITHAVDDGNETKIGEAPALPFKCFDYVIEPFMDDQPSFSLWLKEEVENTEVIPCDDIRDDHVLNLKIFFKERGMYIANTMENMWEVHFDPELNLGSVEDALNTMREALKISGAGWAEEDEKERWKDEEYMPDWKPGMFDVPDWMKKEFD